MLLELLIKFDDSLKVIPVSFFVADFDLFNLWVLLNYYIESFCISIILNKNKNYQI